MNILVCIKQVPDTTEIRMDPKTNTLIRAGVPSTVNPFDKYALEAAVQLREALGGTVTAMTMGPAQAAQALAAQQRAGMTGIEEIRVLLRSYAGLIFTDPAGIRFSLDAEVALCNAGRQHAVVNRPPERFEVAPGPIAAAIRRGLADGTVDPDADVKMLYYNAYDAILGVIQRMSVGVPSVHELDGHARIDALCEQFTRAFAAPPPGEKGTGNTF